MYADTHAHISFPQIREKEAEIMQNCIENDVFGIINVTCSKDFLEENILYTKEVQEKYSDITFKTTLGLHPDTYNSAHAENYFEEVMIYRDTLLKLYEQYGDDIVAIGECGLDYYREFNKDAQRELFRMQIDLARELDLPLIVHVRSAWEDFFEIMNEYPDQKLVLHCFSGTMKEMEQALSYPNVSISFTGVITFKNASEEYTPLLEEIPLERVMIETDSPYLAPVPNRGKVNDPSNVIYVAEHIANIKGLPISKIAQITRQNAEKFFDTIF